MSVSVVQTLIYSFYTFLDQTTNISRKVRAPRRVSASGAPNDVPNFKLEKQTWIIHQCTKMGGTVGEARCRIVGTAVAIL